MDFVENRYNGNPFPFPLFNSHSHACIPNPIPIPIPMIESQWFPFPWESHGTHGIPVSPIPMHTSNQKAGKMYIPVLHSFQLTSLHKTNATFNLIDVARIKVVVVSIACHRLHVSYMWVLLSNHFFVIFTVFHVYNRPNYMSRLTRVYYTVLCQPTSWRLLTCVRTPMKNCLTPSPATATMFYSTTSSPLTLKDLNTTTYGNVHTTSHLTNKNYIQHMLYILGCETLHY